MAERRDPGHDDDPLAYMTARDPSPYLIESQISMLGRMGRGATPRHRLLARVVAILVLAPLLAGVVQGVVQLVRWILP